MVTAFGTPKAKQGELAVGNAWKQLSAATFPCQRVWIGAPTANHPKAGTNIGAIMIAISAGNPIDTSGCRTLASDGSKDGYIHVADAALVWLRGFNGGDSVEYSIEGDSQSQI